MIHARGFSLLETTLALALMSVMVVATMSLVGASQRMQRSHDEGQRGQALADELLAEILARPFEEPTDAAAFGREDGEAADSRANWDDVDDYDGWSGAPPEDEKGAPLPGLDMWRRTCVVEWVDVNDPDTTSLLPTGVKRIRVTALHEGAEVARRTALRSTVWPGEAPPGAEASPPGPFGYDTAFPTMVIAVKRTQVATLATLDADATVTDLSAYTGGTDRKCRFAIYADDAGEPGDLIVESDSFKADGATQWETAAITPTWLAAGAYWLALAFEHDDQAYYHESDGATRYRSNDAVKDGFLSSWGASDDAFPVKVSIHAIYIGD